jgi:formate-dependent nitrite reductase cytochrome c552 subunit
MQGFRKKLARSGIFAALFFASFAILASFHYHEKASGEVSSHHCAVCHNSSGSKVLTGKPAALEAPALSFQNFESTEASQSFAPAPTGNDPIRGPPLA